jgi:hypothetical protein
VRRGSETRTVPVTATQEFFATLECELLDRRRFKTQAEARIAVFEFIEGFYNPRRRHSSLGYLSPIKFECQFVETTLAPGAHEHAVVLAPVKERPGNLAARRTACVPAEITSAYQHPDLCALCIFRISLLALLTELNDSAINLALGLVADDHFDDLLRVRLGFRCARL